MKHSFDRTPQWMEYLCLSPVADQNMDDNMDDDMDARHCGHTHACISPVISLQPPQPDHEVLMTVTT